MPLGVVLKSLGRAVKGILKVSVLFHHASTLVFGCSVVSRMVTFPLRRLLLQVRFQTSPAASAILRLAFGKHIASRLGRIELAPDSGHFDGNRPHPFQGEQEIGCSGSIMRSTEDFILIFL